MNEEKLLHQFLRETKKDAERRSVEILNGETELKIGKEDKEFRPELPDELKGSLLRGLKARGFSSGTKEDAIRKHKQAIQCGYLHKDVKVRYRNDGTYEVIQAVG